MGFLLLYWKMVFRGLGIRDGGVDVYEEWVVVVRGGEGYGGIVNCSLDIYERSY